MKSSSIGFTIAMTLLAVLTVSKPSPAQRPDKIGLALSGGGFRAAAFHLGVLRELDDQGLLDEVDVISCVSGGCIAAAAMLHDWTSDDRFQTLDTYLRTSKGVVKRAALRALFSSKTRTELLAEAYDRDLFEGATLADLKSGPRVYFNATNLSNGTRFFFASGTAPDVPNSWDDVVMRDQVMDPCLAPDFPIANAVAASSAFPLAFNPLKVEHTCLQSQGIESVSLTDGGVYDNLGLGPYIYDINLWSRKLDLVIVSDGGSPFAVQKKAATSGVGVLMRIPDIQMANIRALGLQLLIDRHCLAPNPSASLPRGPRPIFFSIDSATGEETPGDGKFAAGIGTNLERLSDLEMTVLTRHGAALLKNRLRTYAPELGNSTLRAQNVCQSKYVDGDGGGLFTWDP